MFKPEFLDMLLTPIAALTEMRWIVWPFLALATIWLAVRRFQHLQQAPGLSAAIWWIVEAIALVALVCVLLLFFLSPKGPDFYRVALGFSAAIPLVLPGILCCFIRPLAGD
ncbi:MAG TPA: hypothetical protein VGN04_07115 [Herbaspirillum sp.]|jgi:hypothetical protein